MKNEISFDDDFLDFLELCNRFEVRYLVVGGYAVSIHGYTRTTKDLDICIELSLDNAKKMVSVIREFGFESLNLTVVDFLKSDYITQLGYAPLRIDILNDLDGVDFKIAWDNRRVVVMKEIPVNFIGYYELLKVKEKAGRPQDIADVSKLKKRNKSK
jgi:hypothetical protein